MTKSINMDEINVIAFDADDTLWHTENMFLDVQNELAGILDSYAPHDQVQARMNETEGRNIRLFGYGIKGFTLSMVETAIEISGQKISAADIHKIIMMGKEMLDAPMELFDGIHEILSELGQHYRLFLITKGDVLDQRNKIEKSGLEALFERTIVVQEKDPATYKSVFDEYDLDTNKLIMVGNSLKSDVLPVLELGGTGIYIPYHVTAHFEKVDEMPIHPKFYKAENLKALREMLQV